jgi:hypothetical protein
MTHPALSTDPVFPEYRVPSPEYRAPVPVCVSPYAQPEVLPQLTHL